MTFKDFGNRFLQGPSELPVRLPLGRNSPARRLPRGGCNDVMCLVKAQEAGMQARTREQEAAGDAPRESDCRALVPLRPADADRPRSAGRYPAAPFLAHLIAVNPRVAPVRPRRRAPPPRAPRCA